VVHRHLVVPAALLVQPQPPAPAHRVVVLHPQRQGGADAGEAVEQRADQRPVAQAHQTVGRDGGEQRPGLLARRHAGLAGGRDVLRPAHRRGRVVRHHLADHQPVEQHADRRQVLLDARRRPPAAEQLDVGRHVHRPDGG